MDQLVAVPNRVPPQLTPWKKGQSGNPTGHTKAWQTVRAELERVHCGAPVLEVMENLRQLALGDNVVAVMAAKVYLGALGLATTKGNDLPAPLSPVEVRERLAALVATDPQFRVELTRILEGRADAPQAGPDVPRTDTR